MLDWEWGSRWEPLLYDTLLLSQKPERLGFTYYGSTIVIVELTEYEP
jgi:hypothetical protein